MRQSLKILLISGDDGVVALCDSVFASEGHSVVLLPSLHNALTLISGSGPYDAVLLDTARQSSGDRNLLEALTKKVGLGRLWLISILGISLWKETADRLGITNILWRPLLQHDLTGVLDKLDDSAIPQCVPPPPNSSLTQPDAAPCYMEDLPGGKYFLAACQAMKKLYETVRLLAAVDVPVLILGESGVGKDVVATLLHKHSLRSKAAYVSVNCAALPPDLLESELFGYEVGAFTGAVKAKPGKFEIADHGTLLLDEIGEMTAPMQAKLLHVLQDGRFSRLGARTPTQVDVRVIAATNVDIEGAIAQSTFREDLYYRISAFTVNVPPLRERKAEIPFLVSQLLKQHATNFHQDPIYVSSEVLSLMQEYRWPGNLRELSNYVVRMQVLGSTDIVVSDLTARIRGVYPSQFACPTMFREEPHAVADMRSIIRTFKDQTESRLIQEALDTAGWNRRHAAAELRISYRALLYKIQQYGLKEQSTGMHLRRG